MNVGSLFSGIGGIDLGLERAGMHVVWQCESDPFCRAVLRKHWPDVPCYPDVRELADAPAVDLICGGFPCQPVSLAGRGKAQADPRWLWPEFARVVGLLRPRLVLVENVPGLVKRGLADVVGDLAAMGYDAEWQIVSAAAVGAPHLRERLFVVATLADSGGPGRRQDAGSAHGDEGADAGRPAQDDHEPDGDGEGDGAGQVPAPVADADASGRHRWAWNFSEAHGRDESADGGREIVSHTDSGAVQPRWQWGRVAQAGCPEWWASEPDVGRVAHGVPGRLHRLAALGNAVVPQVAEAVGRMILASA